MAYIGEMAVINEKRSIAINGEASLKRRIGMAAYRRKWRHKSAA